MTMDNALCQRPLFVGAAVKKRVDLIIKSAENGNPVGFGLQGAGTLAGDVGDRPDINPA